MTARFRMPRLPAWWPTALALLVAFAVVAALGYFRDVFYGWVMR